MIHSCTDRIRRRQVDIWRDRYYIEKFEFEGREAIIVYPETEEGKRRWALKTEYFWAFQDLEEKLVEKGFHLLYLKNNNRWGTDDDLDAKKRFSEMLQVRYGLSRKCVMIGMSCGGLHAIKQAAKYPEMTSVLYLDAPVVNLLSCPFGLGKCNTDIAISAQKEVFDALRLDMSGIIAYREHPLDKLPQLIAQRIPAILVYGEKDTTVPFEENGKHIRDAYLKSDIPFLLQCKPEANHHPHGPADIDEALNFILANS